MKYLLVYTMNLMLVVLAHAQGTFAFGNRSTPDGIDAPVVDFTGARVSGSSYLAQLWGGSDASSLQPLIDPVTFRTGAAAGYISTVMVTAANIAPGGLAVVEVRVWKAALGKTFLDAFNAPCLGFWDWILSDQLRLQAGGVLDLMTGIPSRPTPLTGLSWQNGAKAPICPEPSVIALELLGGLTLFFWFRKSKGQVSR